jgi:hypothetical protein
MAGWNIGPGLADFGQIIEQGYKDRQALAAQQAAARAKIAQEDIQNLAKKTQIESQYGPYSGYQAVDPSMLAPQQSLESQIEDSAALAAKNRTRTIVNQGSGDVTTFQDQDPGRQPQSDGPPQRQPNQPTPNRPQQPNQPPPAIVDALIRNGGKIGPNGELLVPNYVARRLDKQRAEALQAQILAARLGPQYNRDDKIVIPDHRQVTPRAAAVQQPKFQQAIASLLNEQKVIDARAAKRTSDIGRLTDGVQYLPEEQARMKEIQDQITQLRQLDTQMMMKQAGAPQASQSIPSAPSSNDEARIGAYMNKYGVDRGIALKALQAAKAKQ